MSKKEEFFKERFKQALDSTYKVISEEFLDLNKKKKSDRHWGLQNFKFTL